MASRLYFTALKTLERLEIQFVPKGMSWSRNPNVANVEIVGRNNPLTHYLGGVSELSFQLDFHSESLDREDVIEKCKWLESLAYSDDVGGSPEVVRLTFGRLFRNNELWVVKSVNYDLSLFEEASNYLPKQAYVDLTLQLHTKRNLTRSDVKWR